MSGGQGDQGRGSGPALGEVYLEFHPLGRQVKVTAIHASTGVEVSIFGPSNTAQSDLKNLALRKLQRALQTRADDPNGKGRGILA